MIIDWCMHMGEFPDFGVRLEADSLAGRLAAHKIDAGLVFAPDNAMVRRVAHRDVGRLRTVLGEFQEPGLGAGGD